MSSEAKRMARGWKDERHMDRISVSAEIRRQFDYAIATGEHKEAVIERLAAEYSATAVRNALIKAGA